MGKRFGRERGGMGSERNGSDGLNWMLSETNSRHYPKKQKEKNAQFKSAQQASKDVDSRLGESQKLLAQKAFSKQPN